MLLLCQKYVEFDLYKFVSLQNKKFCFHLVERSFKLHCIPQSFNITVFSLCNLFF